MRTIKQTSTISLFILILSLLLTGCAKNTYTTGSGSETYSYFITKVDDNIDWDSVPVIPIDKVLWTEDYGIRAYGQLCYDDDFLYVHQSAVEKNIRAENTEPLSPVYEDSCLEFFFKLDDGPNYFNFEINPNGCLCNQYGPEKNNRIDITKNDSAEYFDIRTDRTSDGWEVFYRIPLDYIQLFAPGYGFSGKISGNMYKCGNKTLNKHYLSWTDIKLDKPNFHCPEYFGQLIFR